jgi:hypothetical protein
MNFLQASISPRNGLVDVDGGDVVARDELVGEHVEGFLVADNIVVSWD